MNDCVSFISSDSETETSATQKIALRMLHNARSTFSTDYRFTSAYPENPRV